MENNLAQRVLWILWPAFLVAAAAELLFFAIFDPSDLHLFGVPLEVGRVPVYTMGFFFFWAMAAAASAMTALLQRSPFEVNRCPLDSWRRCNADRRASSLYPDIQMKSTSGRLTKRSPLERPHRTLSSSVSRNFHMRMNDAATGDIAA